MFAQSEIDSLINILNNREKDNRLELLKEISEKMAASGHQDEELFLKRTIKAARDHKQYDYAAFKAQYLGRKLNYSQQPDKAIQILNTSINDSTHLENLSYLGYLYLQRAYSFILKNDRKNNLQDLDKGIQVFEKTKDSFWLATTITTKAEHYGNFGDFVNSIKEYEKANSIFNKINNHSGIIRCLHGAADLLFRNGLVEKSNEYLHEALNISKAIKDSTQIGDTYMRIAEGHLRAHQYKELKLTLDQWKKYLKDNGLNEWRFFHLYRSYALYYLNKKNFEKTTDYITLAEEKLHKTQSVDFFENFLIPVKAQYYQETGNHILAVNHYKKLIDKGLDIQFNHLILDAELQISESYETLGDINNALKHKKTFIDLNNSINSVKTKNTYLYQQVQYEVAEKERKLLQHKITIEQLKTEQLIQEAKRKENILLFLLVITLITITSALILIRYRRNKKILKNKLEVHRKELIRFTEIIVARSKDKHELELQVSQLKSEIGEIKAIEQLVELGNSKILTENDWNEFQQKFNKAYPIFFKTIEMNGFNLSKSEKRLVALEKLNLDSNEIANVLAISIESVNKTRYRLRKKFNAPKDINVVDFLSKPFHKQQN